MAEHEGWFAPGDRASTAASRSFRNHNPLNLRYSPFQYSSDEGYSVFRDCIDGFRAAEWDIMMKAQGKTSTGLHGDSSLRDLIETWAPIEDGNDPDAYLKHVCAMTGFEPSMTLKTLLV